jgi:hypothetical protein
MLILLAPLSRASKARVLIQSEHAGENTRVERSCLRQLSVIIHHIEILFYYKNNISYFSSSRHTHTHLLKVEFRWRDEQTEKNSHFSLSLSYQLELNSEGYLFAQHRKKE